MDLAVKHMSRMDLEESIGHGKISARTHYMMSLTKSNVSIIKPVILGVMERKNLSPPLALFGAQVK